MNFRTKQFVRSRFQHYYKTHKIYLPPGFDVREWGFIMFDELPEVRMRRHKAFGSRGELSDYLSGMVPSHAYYSTAYYTYPAARNMKEKGWQGADLIFDLDADHLRKQGADYAEMLENVKTETIKLLDFLTEDFGFGSEHIEVVFSGGRGYHIHVRDKSVLKLESGARREIVDYLTCTGFDYKKIFKNDSTWSMRIAEKVIDYFYKLRFSVDKNEALHSLQRFTEIGKKRSSRVMDTLYEFNTRDELETYFRHGGFGFKQHIALNVKQVAESLINLEGIASLSGETDEPVTTDIKRLIRLPLSLHGGSGFTVTPVAIDALESFNPLIDAVTFGNDMTSVIGIKPFEIQMYNNTYTVEPGTSVLPECAAIYAMCRGACEYGE
ncbi:MAG: DNA primase small subunit [Candidatus Argoarchaeum ethanivorans]|uniref:DNA primase small subunit PriS n=1 Tax=Candidatus Argoarchaeum ethanivorans TaxID=2608793 RepID=A0A811T765_9EURY|nr:MAG: DNA primase small subunit [Candidatus Argoarchaeum ethanivorans]